MFAKFTQQKSIGFNCFLNKPFDLINRYKNILLHFYITASPFQYGNYTLIQYKSQAKYSFCLIVLRTILQVFCFYIKLRLSHRFNETAHCAPGYLISEKITATNSSSVKPSASRRKATPLCINSA